MDEEKYKVKHPVVYKCKLSKQYISTILNEEKLKKYLENKNKSN